MARLTKRQSGEQKRLHEQLDFFGAKKKRFISIYANKPHIRLKVEGDSISRSLANPRWLAELAHQQANQQALAAQLLASQQSQMAAMSGRGLASSQLGMLGGLGGSGQGMVWLGLEHGPACGINPQLTANVFSI